MEKDEDESWGSFFWNTAKKNYELRPKLLEEITKKRLKALGLPQTIIFPSSSKSIELLAYLTRIDPKTLLNATPYRFIDILETPYLRSTNHSFSDGSKYRTMIWYSGYQLHSKNQVRICLECMKLYPHHKTIWYLSNSIICLTHNEILIDKCPKCASNISLYSVIMNECQFCLCRFSHYCSEKVDPNAAGTHAQKLLFNIMFNKELDQLAGIVKTQRAAYRFFIYIIELLNDSLIDYYISDLVGENSFSSSNLYNRQAIAYIVLSNWPRNFHKFLDIYYDSKRAVYRSQGIYHLGDTIENLYTYMKRFGIAQSDLELITRALTDYSGIRYSYSVAFRKTSFFKVNQLRIKMEYLTLDEATLKSDSHSEYIQSLAHKGSLNVINSNDQPPSKLYSQKEIILLRESLAKAYTLLETANLLDLSMTMVRNLIHDGILIPLRGPDIGKYFTWLIDYESVNAFYSVIKEKYGQIPKEELSDKNFVPFQAAISKLERIGINTLGLIKLLYNTPQLRLYGEDVQFPGIRQSLLSAQEIETVKLNYHLRGNLVTRKMIAEMMGVKVGVVKKWIKSGLLTKARKHTSRFYFDRDKITQFVYEHIYVEAASQILGIAEIQICKWIAKGRLHPVSGPHIDGCQRYLLKREEVETWSKKKLLSAPELARQLNMSYSRLLQWVKCGKIKPISGPGIDSYKQYLFELNSEIQLLIESR